MTRDELKIRTQQAINAIHVFKDKDYGWSEMEKMLYEILLELDDSDWQTGTPTEEGEYLCWVSFAKVCKDSDGSWRCRWKDGKWYDNDATENLSMDDLGFEVIAWQKIEPYKEIGE